ncbi:deoxyribodipyrimidine photo-lyase, partial [Bowmanella sp. Y57]|nr:deoxyribodipyrimidine photo-lyase [Bowmanella yangjiangensis]
MQRLMWLRTDLRTQDNTALSEAMLSGPTIALYLITPQQWQRHDDAP